jgi:hypothetical protein
MTKGQVATAFKSVWKSLISWGWTKGAGYEG